MNTSQKKFETVVIGKFKAFLLFGPPGSGKGTQGKVLGTQQGFFHCACGDVFRLIDPSSDAGEAYLGYSRKGQLVPDEITIQLWLTHMGQCIEQGRFKPGQDTLILDGIPRTIAQAEMLDGIIEVQKLIFLSCNNRSQLVDRLKRRAVVEGRSDDVFDEVIYQRLNLFDRESRLLLGHYSKELVCEIDAMQPRADVTLQISRCIATS